MIGLLGGSFNPAHLGHKDMSLYAMKRLNLTEIWWLVTPGNPLKSHDELLPQKDRIEQAKTLSHHPKIKVSGIEAVLNTRYTIDTLKKLQARFPHQKFVWLMGSDNWRDFHRWKRWREIAQIIPIAIIDRPGSEIRATIASNTLAKYRVNRLKSAPCWLYLHGIKNPISSTAIRALNSKKNAV